MPKQTSSWSCALLVTLAMMAPATARIPPIKDSSLAQIKARVGSDVYSGTGFVIDSGYLVTAYHVIHNARRIDVIFERQQQKFDDVEVVAVRPEADVALLRLPGPPRSAPYPVSLSYSPKAGAGVFVHGNPLFFRNQLLSGSLPQDGFVPAKEWRDRNERGMFVEGNLNLIAIDITTEPGLSGGPVLDESGVVFGVLSGSLQASGRGYSWAIPLSYVNLDQMQTINKRASAIQKWPAFNFLRADLSMLRSRSSNSVGSQWATACRQHIEETETAWQNYLALNKRAHAEHQSLKPQLDALVQMTSVAPQVRMQEMHKLGGQWRSMLDSISEISERTVTASDQMKEACFSLSRMGEMMPSDFPATRVNVLYWMKLAKRAMAFATNLGELTKTGEAATAASNARSQRAMRSV